MTNPPPRKRFQIHLSTAIVLMFVAGALMWANVTPRLMTQRRFIGWPVIWADFLYSDEPSFEYTYLIVDLIIAFNILYVTWRFCEWLIRRLAARKGA